MTTTTQKTRDRHQGTREELSGATGDPKMIPAYKIEQVRKLYQRQRTDWRRKLSPWIPDGDGLDEAELKELKDVVFGRCTMCRRCTLTCPMGVDTGMIMRAARGMLTLDHMAPKGLQDTVDIHIMTGNNMGMDKDEIVDTAEWMEEELQKDIGDPTAKIPIDKEGAKHLWVLNPREVKFFPLLLQAQAKIFHAAGESFTLSSKYWDVTNYALFNGDDRDAATIAGFILEEADRLGCDTIICTECGHGMRQLKYLAPIWLKRTDFKVKAFVEVVADYIKTGRIKLDPTVNKERVTYHDPCNQARSGNYIEEPRVVLRNSVMDFVDMTPNGRNNFCCGGGGGALTMSEYRNWRLEAAKVKADQVKATGAEVLATSCHNCIDQLSEINRHYKLGVKVVNTCELTADAIMLPKRLFQGTEVPVKFDEKGYLHESTQWDDKVAQFRANEEGVGDLGDDHWKVINYVRDYNGKHGAWPLPSRIRKELKVDLKRLFRGAPELVFKIAGLTNPGDQVTWHASKS